MIVEKEYGEGKEYIYVYYFPSLKKGKQFPCKIGKSKNNYQKRIKAQQASMKEEPVIALLIKTDNCNYDEMLIHQKLKHLKMSYYGKEWFLANKDIILDAYLEQIKSPDLSTSLKYIRCKNKISQEELASKCGLRQETISAIENGQDSKVSTFTKVVNALNCSIRIIENN